ncbi:MAG: hypothetical protein ACRDVD_02025 [Acidimicrobiia bacterium]
MTTATSGGANARPPVKAVSTPEVSVRPTVRVRPELPVRLDTVDDGRSAGDPYVRRFWVAAIGAGAVAELLRLMRAGANGDSVPLPRWLPVLLRSELVRVEGGELVVASLVPAVPVAFTRRFPPGLREEHRRALTKSRP